jgi:hypothetical protein
MGRRLRILGVALVAAVAGSCFGDAALPEVSAARFTEEDSCGNRFTVRDIEGTMRLTIVASPEATTGTEPAVFGLEADGWAGHLEIGTGLLVWPCHDIGTDFADEDVRQVWPVLDGAIELLDPIVGDTDGRGTDPVRARIHRVVFMADDGSEVALENIAVSNPRWGFAGG